MSLAPASFDASDFPCEDAIVHTFAAARSDLFALFADTALEAEPEGLAWGFVNLFHRAARRKSAQFERAWDGRIHYTQWEDQDGVTRYGTEILADKVDFLSRGNGSGDENDNKDALLGSNDLVIGPYLSRGSVVRVRR